MSVLHLVLCLCLYRDRIVLQRQDSWEKEQVGAMQSVASGWNQTLLSALAL